MVDCQECGDPIRQQPEADTCAESHETHDLGDPVLLHVDCPCPVHGWDGEREGYAQDGFVLDEREALDTETDSVLEAEGDDGAAGPE